MATVINNDILWLIIQHNGGIFLTMSHCFILLATMDKLNFFADFVIKVFHHLVSNVSQT